MRNNPFFIVGCVRSGTTLLRNVLRNHPRLAAPEETHFFRWAEPFGGVQYRKMVSDNRILKSHRELDRIDESEFQTILNQSDSRADLCRRYMQLYIKKNKPGARRWFDKTPQNVYGAALIAGEMPGAQFIHIVRHPMDVASSLKIGQVVKVQSVVGACCYWNEAAEIINVVKRAYPARVHEVKYEDFSREPLPEINKMLDFLDEDFDPTHYEHVETHPIQHDHGKLFSDEELRRIERLCRRWAVHYGYMEAPQETK